MNYLIIGDDEYIRENETVKIKNKFLADSETALNYTAYNSENVDGLFDSLQTMPFLAKKRVVLLKKSEQLSKEFIDLIITYLGNPADTSILVLSSDSSLKEKKYFKQIIPLVQVIKADKPTTLNIREWTRSFFRKQKIEISEEAVDLLVELKGADTAGIKVELEKLVAFSGGEKIEGFHVENLVGRSVKEMVFKLVEAVNTKNALWIFRILNDLYDQKKQPFEIIGYLSWHIKTMRKIKLLDSKGIGLGGIVSELGYSAGYVKRLLYQAKEYSEFKMRAWVSLLFDADQSIKTGLNAPAMAMEVLMVSLLQV
ncbi:MAG: DNA polymerase III subunit delta [Candidatus Omnitrophota bacterium]